MDIWSVLNSRLVLLLLGFIFTTIAGGILTSWLQRQSWKKQTRVDLFRKRYEEGSQFLDELSKVIGNRYFQMQRYLWAIEDTHDDKFHAVESEYFNSVVEWNSAMWVNRNKVRLLVGEAHANTFLDYRDDRCTARTGRSHPVELGLLRIP